MLEHENQEESEMVSPKGVTREDAVEALSWIESAIPYLPAIRDELNATLDANRQLSTFEPGHFDSHTYDLTLVRDWANEALLWLGAKEL